MTISVWDHSSVKQKFLLFFRKKDGTLRLATAQGKKLTKRLDITQSGGLPCLPSSLVTLWSKEVLPLWVCSDLNLPHGTTIGGAFGQASAPNLDEINERVGRFLFDLINSRKREISAVRVFETGWPVGLDPQSLKYSIRTENCLDRVSVRLNWEYLTKITFGDLYGIKAMGTKSVLDFARISSAAISRITGANARMDPDSGVSDRILELIDEPWSEFVGGEDPRFSDLVPRLGLSLKEWVEEITASTTTSIKEVIDSEEIARNLPKLRSRVTSISSASIERALEQMLASYSGFQGVKVAVLLDRLGWSGSAPITLEEAGSRLGITRERVRQLQKKILDRIGDLPFRPFLPQVDLALALVAKSAPLAPREVPALMKNSGISDGAFSVQGLFATAAAVGRMHSISLQSVKDRELVVSGGIPEADKIVRVALSQAGASGASNVDEVRAEVCMKHADVTRAEVLTALRRFSDVEFVDESWFIRPRENAERDRLRNLARKMLSVTEPLSISTIRDGIRRDYKMRGSRGHKSWPLIVPPVFVLHHFFERHWEFALDPDGRLRSAHPLKYAEVLPESERNFVDLIRKSPAGVLDRRTLVDECVKRGMNEHTIVVYMSYCPFLERLAPEVWSLRGTQVDPASIEAIREQNALRDRDRRIVDHGWTGDGDLWVAARLPETVVGLMINIPSAIRDYLAARAFNAVDDGGAAFGELKISESGLCNGYQRFLRQKGADAGDVFFLVFDLVEGNVVLRVGDEESLDELEPV